MSKTIRVIALSLCLLLPGAALPAKAKLAKAQQEKSEEKEPMSAGTFAGLALRSIGPALTSGRIIDLAVDPADPSTWIVAAASGGVWKTTNAGTTWTPVFDGQSSYSIGCVAIDPRNPLVVWVGTGENNSQRSVSYGDGVYKSVDGGKSWTNVGLGASEHIGKIIIDPRDSDVVYVAAQGPLWGPGGDRGLYKTTDGGKSWKKVLEISENTGVSDIAFHPTDPDTLYAAAYQRRRRVWGMIDGGPESAIYKSTDAGETWKKVDKGLPKADLGRIGLAVAPGEPDWVYAIIEAHDDKDAGFYRSTDRGENWERRSDFSPESAQYYQELFVDPADAERVYAVNTFLMVSDDAGKSFHRAGEEFKHVDNHVVWIDPHDSRHLLVGCDGGLYETFDRAATWNFTANLPVTQFYKVSVDQALPFYNVFGGTQDNFSLGGPSRTTSGHGIVNSDWFVTQGGDGFETQVDPEDSNIIYAQAQYGELGRFDKASGESIDIQPQPEEGETLRWNWDAPLLISPHSHTRLYFAANRLFRSDDRGDTWRAVSPDLTRQIDRNQLQLMGRVWGVDAVAKNASTSFYGTIVALSESPLVEGLLYVGTDDGLIQVSEDGGATWRKIDSVPGVPDRTYVSRVEASQDDADTVYAAFDAHKDADFKPYVLVSTDRGRTWKSIAGDLPARGSVYALAEDPVDPKLLFAGTEFGVFFTVDGGGKWVQLTGGMPTIAVRDLAIQKREGDLVLASFGRGFYVLDDYSPLRQVNREALEKGPMLFPVKKAWMYIEENRMGLRGKAFQGHSFFTAPNPPFGAIFTYYLKDEIQTRKEKREEAEKKAAKEGTNLPYPSWKELRAEDREEKPTVLLTVSDEDGNVIQRVEGPVSAGIHRVAWDLRYPPSTPTRLTPPPPNPFGSPPQGPMVVPGTYTVSLSQRVDGEVTPLAGPVSFETAPLGLATLPARDRSALLAFQRKTGRLQRAVLGAIRAAEEAQTRLDNVKKALDDTPAADQQLADRARELEGRLKDLQVELVGDDTIASRNEPTTPAISDRVQRIVFGSWTSSTAAATATEKEDYDRAAQAFGPVLDKLRQLIEVDLAGLEKEMEAIGAPWTPGRVPEWHPE